MKHMKCIKCKKGDMEKGIIVDLGHYDTAREPTWVNQLSNGKYFSTKLFGDQYPDKKFNVITYRCVNCGFLESYTEEKK